MALDTNDKRNAKGGKILVSKSFDPRLGAYLTSTNQGVSAAHEIDSQTYGTLHIELENERNVGEARYKKETAEFVPLYNKERTIGSPELSRFAVSITERRETLDHQTLPSLAFLDISADIEAVDTVNNLWRVKVASDFTTLTKRIVDEELGLPLLITESVVDLQDPGYAVPANTKGAFYSDQKVDDRRAIRSAITIVGYPDTFFSRVTYESVNYNFPSLLTTVVQANGFIASQRRSYFQLQLVTRNGFSAEVNCRVLENLVTYAEATALIASTPFVFPNAGHLGDDTHRADLFTPIAADLEYQGFLINVSKRGVLTNGFTLTATTNLADTYFGNVVDTVTFAATNITASVYIANIGNEVCIGDFVKPWKYGMYWRRRIYIKLI